MNLWKEAFCLINLLLLNISINLMPEAVDAGYPDSLQQNLLRYYDYNASMPLNASETIVTDTPIHKVLKIYYDSANDERVPALLSLPKSNSEVPCVVFLHGYGGSKEDVLDVAELVAREGYAMMAIDAEYHGERSEIGRELYSPNITDTLRGITQTVIDLRRAVDYLETRREINEAKIGYAGGSMGGILGAIFIGVEPRIKAAALIVAGGNMSLMVTESQHSTMPAVRQYLQRENLSNVELQTLLDPIDPINFIANFAPRPLALHLGRFDTIVPAEAGRQLFEKAEQPKEVYWYETGHNVPLDLVLARVLDFMDRHLWGKTLVTHEVMHWTLRYGPPVGVVAAFVVSAGYLISRKRKGRTQSFLSHRI